MSDSDNGRGGRLPPSSGGRARTGSKPRRARRPRQRNARAGRRLEDSRNGRALRDRSGGQPSGTERRPSRRSFWLSGATQAAPEPNDQQVYLYGTKETGSGVRPGPGVSRFGCGLTFSRAVWVRILFRSEQNAGTGARAATLFCNFLFRTIRSSFVCFHLHKAFS